MLELAVLGLLHNTSMHGYELRKQLNDTLGVFRALSCGSLYPTLRRLCRSGLIEEESDTEESKAWGRRARRVYRITTAGEQRFDELVTDSGPRACEDNAFGVHVVFFSRTPAEARMRILLARRRRVEERQEGLRSALARSGDCLDRYTRELHRLRLDHSEREVRWLDEIIEAERVEQAAASATGRPDAGGNPDAGHQPPAQITQGHDR
ncbi:PadR family transcriptional regulator [Saccharopolyspora dendranthemae]|uniref:DNA-binding PadR family transcriptional regulator n=1 Tax=Saccharopolyspora dendranthemae TaxID=1181886 RepID=A0A561U5J9_9PSEU|nr:PadR family transcriptional regulator [Saccharopolyspora dendranthemae]TWF94634.1 DNA-binding PadR family transcriptional regulator [Saccharopolyspora dendranthemae]